MHNGTELTVGKTGVKKNASACQRNASVCQRKLFCCLDVRCKVIASKIYNRAWLGSKRVCSNSNMAWKVGSYKCGCFVSHSDIVTLEYNCIVIIANLSSIV